MSDRFARSAQLVSEIVGTPRAFGLALAVVIAWAVTGPFFHFSDTWQLVINTGTTVITFLMVFVIQATQNRDSRALHLKLDELIRSKRQARNAFADLEHATEEELQELEAEFRELRLRAESRRSTAAGEGAESRRSTAAGEGAPH